jgi:hypothetical protein
MVKNFILCGTVFLLLGCAGVAPRSDSASSAAASSESQVSARAEARWQAMAAKDLDKAYEFLSPGSKAAFPLALFKGRIRLLDWRPAKARSASCDAEKCSVKLDVTFSNRRLRGEVTTVVEEIWIKDVGNWWLVFNG